MHELSVSDALDRLADLNGTTVTIFGRLSLEFEGKCVNQIAQRDVSSTSTIEPASIWTEFDMKAIGQDVEWLRQFDCRHVRLTGTLQAPDDYGGCGHFGMWPAQITVTSIEKRKLQ